MTKHITEEDVSALLEHIKDLMGKTLSFRKETIEGTHIKIIHPEYWEVSLLIPYANTNAKETRRIIEGIMFNECGIEKGCCDYFGRQSNKKAYEWYFRHPQTPVEVREQIELEIEAEEETDLLEEIPEPTKESPKSDTAFLALDFQFFDEIASGKKTKEYRALNQYYCDKFFAGGTMKRFVKFNRGYQSGAGNQMIFEIEDIQLVNSEYEMTPVRDEKGKWIVSESQLPFGFIPIMYGLILGKRIS